MLMFKISVLSGKIKCFVFLPREARELRVALELSSYPGETTICPSLGILLSPFPKRSMYTAAKG